MPGVRCQSCKKFASLETGDEPKISGDEVDGDAENGFSLHGEVRVVRTCADCGDELKEANLEFTIECPEGYAEDWEYELEAEPTERVRNTNKEGRPVESRRYMKSFYGASITATFRPPGEVDEGEEITATTDVEEQASFFEGLV